jgi:sugar/nucleoside kinase (ribokinase family)
VKRGIFVGASTVDIVYGLEAFPPPNTKVVALRQDVFAGGSATNASITFSHLGGKSTLMTAVGAHPLTVLIRQELDRRLIELIDLNPTVNEVPVISSIFVNRAGQRNIVATSAARVDNFTTQADIGGYDGVSVVLVDGHHMSVGQAWAKAARDCGIEVVLDGGSWKPGTKDLLDNVSTAICSNDFRPPGCSCDDDVIRRLKDWGVRNVAITNGAKPIKFATDSESGLVPVQETPTVDTMGAGDIFHGAYCYYSTRGFRFPEALEKAAAIASESCKYFGPREWMMRQSGKGVSQGVTTGDRLSGATVPVSKVIPFTTLRQVTSNESHSEE